MRQMFATLVIVLSAGETHLGKPGLCTPQQREGSFFAAQEHHTDHGVNGPGSLTHQGSDGPGWCG